ncbi:hypothetical protein [Levilactobacillus yonginensis]
MKLLQGSKLESSKELGGDLLQSKLAGRNLSLTVDAEFKGV